ncbi:class I SAM-dependent methyltransferase family protein [Halomicroarcula sp. S1AR25-4]|uniref:class I SAM-dependent methyltransferase n=1 Tax=Haloarcula sp. S1AR25-4 TaxID=2950538 RepID=UPI0028756E0E|nr:class I SAM-dependent methyltransferase family protein [Halomicroarcula sp. S1AR25-4]MDS0279167.1 class I SAM-dependent methyltransferase family protein [Halomicroarcula sp. S1AR25-4]
MPEDDADRDQRLAVVVAKPRAQTVIDALTNEGVYDADRSVRSWDDDGVAVPVTAPPQTVDVREIVQQVGEPRLRTLEDHLRQRGWTDDELDAAPSSWAVVGSVVLVDVGDAPRPEEVGQALLALHGEADTVLDRGGISGDHREPNVTVVAGEGDTETVHTEHGTRYGLDLAEVMFSPGNKAERARMGDAVEAGERVLDMFAGIGYFTLPMARAGASVTAVERNPTAFRYLVENVMQNGVDRNVQPYRADCRDVVPEFAREARADRVLMGYYEAHEYLDSALDALAPGGVLHMHEATPEALVFERPIERLEAAADDAGRSVEVLDTRRVKGYSEGVAHVVVDARIE